MTLRAGGHDGTDVRGLVEVRHGKPTPIVFAVGERHPTDPWRPSVYQIAHARLHPSRP